MPQKVLIIDPADFVGGAELFTIDLIKNLKSKDFEVEALTGGNERYEALLPDDIKVHHFDFPKLKLFALKSLSNLKEVTEELQFFIEEGEYDIVHTNSVRAHIIASLACKDIPARLCWFLHDFTFPQILMTGLANYADHIMCCSHSIQEALLSAASYNSATFDTKTSVIPNGVDLQSMQKIAAKAESENENEDTKFAIIGRIDRWKGQDVFIKAASIILKRFRSVQFYVIGQPVENDEKTESFYDEIQRLTKYLGIEDRVTFTGFKEDLFPFIASMDCIVHASTQKEPFGRTIIEAMALNKAVIASNFGGPKEIITHLEDGILIPPANPAILADVMQKMIQDSMLRKRLSENAAKKVEKHFTIEHMVEKVTDVWQSLSLSEAEKLQLEAEM